MITGGGGLVINIIDLFAGAGGLSEGFRTNEFRTLCHVEMNKSACDTLITREAYHYFKTIGKLDFYNSYIKSEITREEFLGSVPQELIKKVINHEISRHTLPEIFDKIDEIKDNEVINGIIGGPPCQAFSTIGRHSNASKKSEDERIYLYTFYVEFLNRYRPDFFLFENVKGLLSFKDEFEELLLPKIIDAFRNCGYSIQSRLINSAAFGVPQNRERLFIFGLRDDIEDFNLFGELVAHEEMPINIKNLFHDLPKLGISDYSNNYLPILQFSPLMDYLRQNTNFLSLHETRYQNLNDLQIYKIVANYKQNGKQVKYNDLPEHLIKHKNTTSFLDRFKAIDYNGVSHTLVAHIAKDGHYYIHPDLNQNRSISIREAARIQTFPDNYFFEGNRAQKLTQIGNAVPPYLSRKLALTIRNLYV